MEALKKFFWSVALALVCLWPVWTYLLVRGLLDPHGFWQKLVVMGLGFYCLAGLQIIFAVIFLVVAWALWTSD